MPPVMIVTYAAHENIPLVSQLVMTRQFFLDSQRD
jgi:hypothetical protein